MSEPRAHAKRIQEISPGIFHWSVHDDRIDYRSDAYALRADEGTVLVDPLPIDASLVSNLGDVAAICLTGGFHQRAAWRYRRVFGAPVWAPEASRGLEEKADHFYESDERLPGGLVALHAPGPAHLHFVFLLERPDHRAALFSADLLIRRTTDDPFGFVPDPLQDNPGRTRESVEALLEVDADALYPAHGAPLLRGAHEAMRLALTPPR